MKATFLIKTQYNAPFRWSFEEVHLEKGSYKGDYVLVFDADEYRIVDCVDLKNHTQFNFDTFCSSFIKSRVGAKLTGFHKED